MINTELKDQRKNFCENLKKRYVTPTTLMSYGCLSDVTEITFCQGTKHTPACNSIVAIMVTDLWRHLT